MIVWRVPCDLNPKIRYKLMKNKIFLLTIFLFTIFGVFAQKTVRIGIIGLDTSHSIAFAKELNAKDKKVIQNIKDKKVFKRDPVTSNSSLVTLQDYKGLYNRSKHTANFNIQYRNVKYKADANLLVKYRGKFGFQGINNYVDGNDILDDSREFADGYTLINVVLNKEVGKKLSIQAGINNLLNYTEPVLMPFQFGRGYFVKINFKLL